MLNVAIVGPGLVGKELLHQLNSHATHAAKVNSQVVQLPVVGIINSRRMLLGPVTPDGKRAPLPSLGAWADQLQGESNASTAASLSAFVDELVATHQPTVVVDCTSSLEVAQQYPAWLAKGLHVVTPNKKGFSSEWSLYEAITKHSRLGNASDPTAPWVYHESTVGAGLPVLNSLYDLVKTGDEIVKIEGIFSGTLSYLFNEFSSPTAGASATKSFSDIVTVAKSLGYTEPDPRDDLNGMDVARKVTILARVAGLKVSLDDLAVENIVPEALRSAPSPDAFMQQLPDFDAHFSDLNDQAQHSKTVLRYVGVVDPKGQSSVKLMKYPVDHPFANLKGSDNIIAFTTKYFPNPLIIQGAGAGAAVTAFGIFSDIIKVAERV
ncbi:Homoserine dehydrogenase [Dimargaris verticillata]|uniref:Homoserine dehydrogenase n=1 Tax=Dimargaris verticillata TaxID=2761393 RepID=A0A9W8ECX3_9FUNG|nr:Homoserine dehydrogenase [Dimargaris verticillata]